MPRARSLARLGLLARLAPQARRGLLALVGLSTITLTASPASAGERWPLWPSEIQRAAEPLRSGQARNPPVVPEAHKLQALRALERYPTALVAPILLEALADPTASVRREALQACLERVLPDCIPAALREWRSERPDLGARVAALRVIALDVERDPAHTQLLIDALREPDESIRAEAAHTLARVPWPTTVLPRVRTALIARLTDQAPNVRRAAARSLGLLGPPPPIPTPTTPTTTRREPTLRIPDPAPLALTRLLADPDPQVRQDAAEALGNLRDPRALGPLQRVLEAGDESFVSRTLLSAIAALPGPEVDAALLRLLDAPPRAIAQRLVAEAIARRFAPSQVLLDGLIARLREDTLQTTVLELLLQLGEAAGPALRAVQARGLEPQLALPIARLLAALEPPTRAASLAPTWPAPADRDAWHQRLADPVTALSAALALAADPPAWLGRAATAAMAHEHGPTQRRPWLLALATAPRALLPADDAAAPARLATWASDAGLAVFDRCLALAALGHGHPPAHADLAAEALTLAARDPRPAVRACAAALATDDELLAGLLHDDSPRVRAVASHHVAACPLRPGPATQSRLAQLALTDAHPGVIRAATAALAHLRAPSPEPCSLGFLDLGEARGRPVPGRAGPGWIDLRWRGQDLRLPFEQLGDRRYLLLPGLEGATVLPLDITPPRPEIR